MGHIIKGQALQQRLKILTSSSASVLMFVGCLRELSVCLFAFLLKKSVNCQYNDAARWDFKQIIIQLNFGNILQNRVDFTAAA